MNVGALPVDGIMARISSIESRFEIQRDESIGVIDAIDFDPFGEAYQSALQTRDRSTAPSAAPNMAAYGLATGGFGDSRSFAARGSMASDMSDPLISAAVRGVASAGGARPAGGYGSMPVPSELQTYGNGRIPTDRLAPLAGQSGHRLFAPAAAAWDSVVAAAAQDGFDLRITDSYRSYDQQVDLAERKGLYKNGGLAATPGKSNHGWGLAVDADLLDPQALAWMRENGPRFGWVESVPREPWHWEFRPHQV